MLNKIPTIQQLLEEKQQLLEEMWRHKPQEATHIYRVTVKNGKKFLITIEEVTVGYSQSAKPGQ